MVTNVVVPVVILSAAQIAMVRQTADGRTARRALWCTRRNCNASQRQPHSGSAYAMETCAPQQQAECLEAMVRVRMSAPAPAGRMRGPPRQLQVRAAGARSEPRSPSASQLPVFGRRCDSYQCSQADDEGGRTCYSLSTASARLPVRCSPRNRPRDARGRRGRPAAGRPSTAGGRRDRIGIAHDDRRTARDRACPP